MSVATSGMTDYIKKDTVHYIPPLPSGFVPENFSMEGQEGAGQVAGMSIPPLPEGFVLEGPKKQPLFDEHTRINGTPKGPGFLGELKRPDGLVSTELSIGSADVVPGKETLIPALVPTLTKSEIDYALSGGKIGIGPVGKSIVTKAIIHAKQRIAQGKSPFLESGEKVLPTPSWGGTISPLSEESPPLPPGFVLDKPIPITRGSGIQTGTLDLRQPIRVASKVSPVITDIGNKATDALTGIAEFPLALLTGMTSIPVSFGAWAGSIIKDLATRQPVSFQAAKEAKEEAGQIYATTPKSESGKALWYPVEALFSWVGKSGERVISEVPQKYLPPILDKMNPEEKDALLSVVGEMGFLAVLPKLSHSAKVYASGLIKKASPLYAKDVKILIRDAKGIPAVERRAINSLPDDLEIVKPKPKPVVVEPSLESIGRAYRSYTGYKHEKGQTAADVVRYEQETLGNKLGVPAKTISELENRPATDVVWVTKTKEAADRYGEGVEYEIPSGSKILAEDGDGGYLVLKPVSQQETAVSGQAGDLVVDVKRQPDGSIRITVPEAAKPVAEQPKPPVSMPEIGPEKAAEPQTPLPPSPPTGELPIKTTIYPPRGKPTGSMRGTQGIPIEELTGLERWKYEEKMGIPHREAWPKPSQYKRRWPTRKDYYQQLAAESFIADIEDGKIYWGDLSPEQQNIVGLYETPERIAFFKTLNRIGPTGETLGEFQGRGYQGADREAVKAQYEEWLRSEKQLAPTGRTVKEYLEDAFKREALNEEGQYILDEMERAGISPNKVNDIFWNQTYDLLPDKGKRAIEKYVKSLWGFKPGDVYATQKGKPLIAESWKQLGIEMKLGDNISHLEGTDRGYVVLMQWANDIVAKATAPERVKALGEGSRAIGTTIAKSAPQPAPTGKVSPTSPIKVVPSPRPSSLLTPEQKTQVFNAVDKNTSGTLFPKNWRWDDEQSILDNRQSLVAHVIENYKPNSVEMGKNALDPVRLEHYVNSNKKFFRGGEKLTRKARETALRKGEMPTYEGKEGTLSVDVTEEMTRPESSTTGKLTKEIRLPEETEAEAQRKNSISELGDVIKKEYGDTIKNPTEKAAYDVLKDISQEDAGNFSAQERLLKERGVAVSDTTLRQYWPKWMAELQEHGKARRAAIEKTLSELKGNELSSAIEKLYEKTKEDIGKEATEGREGPPVGLSVKNRPRPRTAPAGEEPYTFPPEIEELYQATKKIPQPTHLQRATQHLVDFKNGITRIYQDIPHGKEFIEFVHGLKNLEAQPKVIHEQLKRIFDGIYRNIGKEGYDLVSRAMIVEDLLGEAEAGRNVPFKFNLDSLRTASARLKELVRKDPLAQKAIADRKMIWDGLRKEYIYYRAKVGHEVEHILVNPNYVRHRVLEAVETRRRVRGEREGLRVRDGQDFLKRRAGNSKPILSDLLSADFEVMSRMMSEIEDAKFIDKMSSIYNEADKFRAIAKQQGVPVESVIPDTHTKYLMNDGPVVYPGDIVPAKIAQQIIEGQLEDMGVVKDSLRKGLVLGKDRNVWIVRKEIADTLEKIGRPKTESHPGQLFRGTTNVWKKAVILGPRRVPRFFTRTIGGDIDIVIAANPRAFMRVPQAVKESLRLVYGRGPITGELNEFFKRGALSSTITAQELSDLGKIPMFKRLYEGKTEGLAGFAKEWNPLAVGKKLWQGYWREIGRFNNAREFVLRYANYLEYLDEMKKNPNGRPKNFGASIPEEIMGLSDIRDRAFRLSNENMGAYNEVSPIGQATRTYAWPFFSFKETNTRRYFRLIKNVAANDEVAGRVGNRLLGAAKVGTYTALRAGRFAIKAFGLTAFLAAVNNTIFKKEEADLPEDVRARPHIILGRYKNGDVRAFTRLGSLGDFLELFGLDASYSHVTDFLNGRKSIKEIAKEMAMSPVNMTISGMTPIIKGAAELLSGRSYFPDIRKPRLIRDKIEYMFRQIGLENEYRAIVDKPGVPYKRTLDQAFVYRYDPLQSAYYDFLDIKRDYLKSIGREVGAMGGLTPSSQALYNMKMAHRYGDKKQEEKYIDEYIQLVAARHIGESPSAIKRYVREGLIQTYENLDPLFGIKQEDRAAYASSLSPEAQDLLMKAYAFYNKFLLGEQD